MCSCSVSRASASRALRTASCCGRDRVCDVKATGTQAQRHTGTAKTPLSAAYMYLMCKTYILHVYYSSRALRHCPRRRSPGVVGRCVCYVRAGRFEPLVLFHFLRMLTTQRAHYLGTFIRVDLSRISLLRCAVCLVCFGSSYPGFFPAVCVWTVSRRSVHRVLIGAPGVRQCLYCFGHAGVHVVACACAVLNC